VRKKNATILHGFSIYNDSIYSGPRPEPGHRLARDEPRARAGLATGGAVIFTPPLCFVRTIADEIYRGGRENGCTAHGCAGPDSDRAGLAEGEAGALPDRRRHLA
jgi:hypothetical protein